MKTISVIVPAYNEQDNLPLFYTAITKVWQSRLKKYTLEIIFINDGSRDQTQEIIEALAAKDARVKVIELSRNFGKEAATTAGLHLATGDAAMMVDADLQHPLELIPEFVDKWQQGADVVVGIRRSNKNEGVIKKQGSRIFYRLLNMLSETRITPHATDFRLINRYVLETYKQFSEHNRMTRGLLDWLGFKQAYVDYDARARHAGVPGYTHFKLFQLALSSFIAHSLFPLRFAMYLGVITTIVALPLGIFILFEKYVFHDPWDLNITGSATLGVFTMFFIGQVLFCLGLMALYIGQIHTETANRPLYVVRRTINLENRK